MLVKRGDKVRYIGGRCGVGYCMDCPLKHGEAYTVFGYDSANPSPDGELDRSRAKQNRDTISIRVDDPGDNYGGVLSFDVSLFGVPQWEVVEEKTP